MKRERKKRSRRERAREIEERERERKDDDDAPQLVMVASSIPKFGILVITVTRETTKIAKRKRER